MKDQKYFYFGATILILLLISFFIKIPVGGGSNFIEYAPLLGILIFYNPFILGLYILVAIVLISKGIRS